MSLHTIERFSDRKIREGEMVYVCAVEAANIIRDVREMITNTFGGRMKQYEKLTHTTIEIALERLDERAKELGYDGVMGVRLSHPTLVEGGMEVVAYGTGFHFINE